MLRPLHNGVQVPHESRLPRTVMHVIFFTISQTGTPMATDSILRPGELKNLLLKEIQAADLADIDVREVGTVLEVKDGIARIYGLTSAMAGGVPEFTGLGTGVENAA